MAGAGLQRRRLRRRRGLRLTRPRNTRPSRTNTSTRWSPRPPPTRRWARPRTRWHGPTASTPRLSIPSSTKPSADLYAPRPASYAGGGLSRLPATRRATTIAGGRRDRRRPTPTRPSPRPKPALSDAEAIAAPTNYPKEYSEAKGELSDAIAAYDNQDFVTAAQKARACVAALAMVKAKTPSWPAVYVVRLIPSHRDCLWRIAEYSFIYNNPLKWRVIYEANKKTFRDPGIPTSSSRDKSSRSRASRARRGRAPSILQFSTIHSLINSRARRCGKRGGPSAALFF